MAPASYEDPYAPRKEGRRGVALDFQSLIRYGAAAMGAILIVVGLVLAVSVFGLIRNIIETPDTFVANLDAWTKSDTAETPAPVTAPPADQAPTVPPQTATESPPPADPVETAPESPPPANEPEQADASANQDAEKTPQDLLKALESGRNQATAEAANRPAPQPKQDENIFREILDMIREDGMGRVAGATFIFLFAALLSHIPIMLIRVGVQLLAATAKIKVPAAD